MSATADRRAEAATESNEPSESREFQTKEVLTIASGHFVHDSYSAFVAPLLPLIREKLAVDYAAIGSLAIFSQMPSLLQPFIGHAADRISLRYFIILAPATTATLCGLLGLANSYTLLAMLLFVIGVSMAIFHAPAPAMVGRISGDRLGTGMSIFMAAGELGRTVGPAVVIAAVTWFGLEGIWRVSAFGWLASVFLYWRLRGISARPAQGKGLSLRQMLPGARQVYPPLLWIMASRVFMSISMTTWLPIFMQDVKGYEFEIAGLSLTLLEGAGVVGALTVGTASDWLGRRRILIVLFLVAPLLFLGFQNSTGWLLFAFIGATWIYDDLANCCVVGSCAGQLSSESCLGKRSFSDGQFRHPVARLVVAGVHGRQIRAFDRVSDQWADRLCRRAGRLVAAGASTGRFPVEDYQKNSCQMRGRKMIRLAAALPNATTRMAPAAVSFAILARG